MKVLKFILQTSSPFKSVLILMLLGVLIMAIDSNVRPYIIKLLVDKTEKFIVRDYIFLASCYIASHSLRAIFHAVVDWGATCYSARYREYVSCLALKKINKYPYSFFQDNLNGNIIANISDIFNLVPQLMIAMVCDFIHLVFLVIISLIFLAYINPLCSLLAFLWTGVFCLS
ncbi:MAG: ABC transporter ATP-binding protein, partial [Alphaproteobacteria bacterium]|nr:ABC transporter ATP-binding protein [Alphaproteobacteria bacterium]